MMTLIGTACVLMLLFAAWEWVLAPMMGWLFARLILRSVVNSTLEDQRDLGQRLDSLMLTDRRKAS